MPTQSESIFTVLTPVVSGLVGTVIIGVLLPVIGAFAIDAVGLLVHRRDPRPLIVVVGATIAALAFGFWSLRSAAEDGSPAEWVVPSVVLFWLTGGVATLLAVRRTSDEWTGERDRPEAAQGPGRMRPILGGSHGGAALAAQWMRDHGAVEVQVLPTGADDRPTVRSIGHLAHVWEHHGEAGANAVRELFGLAEVLGLDPLYFSAGGYSSDALGFARLVQMPLFDFHAGQAIVSAANPAGLRLLQEDLREEAHDSVA